ncbi:MAG: wax ester/triacylglycerol synthase family O-acyltransferase [Salinisphaera sp.]|nr:wax ester/triacylglycerol synthase family O-acyltransferase [Salinisphaera sp.]
MTISRETVQSLRAWGGPSQMGAFEAVMWRAEVDPRLRSHGVSLHLMETAADWERLLAGHEWAVRAIPRFREKVMGPVFGTNAPAWVEDPDFDLGYHLRRIRLPAPGSQRQLLDCLQAFGAAPCDRARPQWEALLIEGLEDGGSAYALKMHHAMTDGKGLVQLFEHMLGSTAESQQRAEPRARIANASAPAGQKGGPARALTRELFKAPLRMAAATGWWARRRPSDIGKFASYLDSARRVLAPVAAKPSPLMRRRSLATRYDVIDVDLAGLKGAGKRAGCSLNDALLAAVIGGFARYHQAYDIDIDAMPIGFPISIRSDADGMGGNRFVGATYAAPMDEPDPVARMQAIREFVLRVRCEPAIDAMVRLMPAMALLPDTVLARATAAFTTSLDVQISNIPGSPAPVYLAGARVTRHYPFGPRPGCAAMLAMFSYDGRCCLGINSDPAAVAEPELLMESLEREFAAIIDEASA